MNSDSLPLPDSLRKLIDDGLWVPPDRETLTRVFGADAIQNEPPSFYSIDRMIRENKAWRERPDPLYHGTRAGGAEPGVVDPNRLVLIGDLGTDVLIGLDCSRYSSKPSVVVLLDIPGDSSGAAHWVKVADETEGFLKMLVLQD